MIVLKHSTLKFYTETTCSLEAFFFGGGGGLTPSFERLWKLSLYNSNFIFKTDFNHFTNKQFRHFLHHDSIESEIGGCHTLCRFQLNLPCSHVVYTFIVRGILGKLRSLCIDFCGKAQHLERITLSCFLLPSSIFIALFLPLSVPFSTD